MSKKTKTEAYKKAIESLKGFEEYNCKGCTDGEKFCRRPCWGTPDDIKKIIKAGYGERLMVDYWSVRDGEDVEIVCPANPNYEASCAPEVTFLSFGGGDLLSGCTFQGDDKLCEIYKIRPFEGKTSCCKRTRKETEDLHEKVMKTWNTEEGKELVKEWKEKFLW